jgi:hypothetical protein
MPDSTRGIPCNIPAGQARIRAGLRQPGECSMWLEFIYKNPDRWGIEPGCWLGCASFAVVGRQIFIPHSRTGVSYQQILMQGMQDKGSSIGSISSIGSVGSGKGFRHRASGFRLRADNVYFVHFVCLVRGEGLSGLFRRRKSIGSISFISLISFVPFKGMKVGNTFQTIIIAVAVVFISVTDIVMLIEG